jgi:hypothetical protein
MSCTHVILAKRCPRCSMLIDKDAGCARVHCVCGTGWRGCMGRAISRVGEEGNSEGKCFFPPSLGEQE